MKTSAILLAAAALLAFIPSCKKADTRPRVLVSSDIGGTDPDDNQSMAHLLMFSDFFRLEGLVSSPSYGNGTKGEIERMIGLYEKDYPALKEHAPNLATPDYLRSICKQGRHGMPSPKGWGEPTEGSEWIIECARRKSDSPLWVLVWGGIEDVAQALHDAPDILPHIRVYWIGGPNKKWGVNAYAYLAQNFPDLWIIENNSAYRGFISRDTVTVKGTGALGADFPRYYKGVPKMGDTPSVLYMMDGDPNDPTADSWGGSFEHLGFSPHNTFARDLTLQDTVRVYSVMDMIFDGPEIDVPEDSVVFTMTTDRQNWPGYYIGGGRYMVRYSPKQEAVLHYTTRSALRALDGHEGDFVVNNIWPGQQGPEDFPLGADWYSDLRDPAAFQGRWQGAETVRKHRQEVLDLWDERWGWLK